MGISAGIMAIATLAGSVYSASEQRKATAKASDRQQQAEMNARKTAAEQKPMEESATLLTDTGSKTSALGSLGLLIDPTAKTSRTLLNTSGSAGLSTSSTNGLGFGS